MQMSMSACKQTLPLAPPGVMDRQVFRSRHQKEKVVVVMGATGAGKSKLSIDLARRFSPAEVVNSDKMQVYKGLEIATNKITEEESCGVPHHLLGVIDPDIDFTAANFCSMTSLALQSITGREKLPIIVGGSNSFIEALVDEDRGFRSKYEVCFLWVDVSMPVLHSYIAERVDRMVDRGLITEVRNIYHPRADYSRGIRRAIGVPELDNFFRAEPFSDKTARARVLEKAIDDIKINTCKLACRQLEKIRRLKRVKGWKIHQLDATDVFRNRGKESDEAWKNHVLAPSTIIVDRFLDSSDSIFFTSKIPIRAAAMGTAVAAATH